MSRFYASIQGNRGEATRQGHNTGIKGHIRGWNLGVKVCGYVDPQGRDVFKVYRTAGSNHRDGDRLLCTITDDPDLENLSSEELEAAAEIYDREV